MGSLTHLGPCPPPSPPPSPHRFSQLPRPLLSRMMRVQRWKTLQQAAPAPAPAPLGTAQLPWSPARACTHGDVQLAVDAWDVTTVRTSVSQSQQSSNSADDALPENFPCVAPSMIGCSPAGFAAPLSPWLQGQTCPEIQISGPLAHQRPNRARRPSRFLAIIHGQYTDREPASRTRLCACLDPRSPSRRSSSCA